MTTTTDTTPNFTDKTVWTGDNLQENLAARLREMGIAA